MTWWSRGLDGSSAPVRVERSSGRERSRNAAAAFGSASRVCAQDERHPSRSLAQIYE